VSGTQSLPLAAPVRRPRDLINANLRLPSLPASFVRAKQCIDDPNSSLAAVGVVIAHDPALSARLLRLANSAFFGYAARVDTVPRAVILLGTQQVHDLLLATSVATAFQGIPPELVDMSAFWRNSVRCAVAARLLAARCNVLDSERLFVEGLLYDVGHLLMYQALPELAAEALARARAAGRDPSVVERELIGFDYAALGAELLAAWKLPESLVEAVRHHLDPWRAERFPLEAAIVHVASRIARFEAAGCDAPPDCAVTATVWRLIGLSEAVLEPLAEEVRQHGANAYALIFSPRHAA